jgi:hypothetical protein
MVIIMQTNTFIDKALVGLIFVIVAILAAQKWLEVPPEVLSTFKDALLAVVTLFVGKKIPQDL